jgi:hypothetical protein
VAPSNQPSASHALDAIPTTELMRQALEETKEHDKLPKPPLARTRQRRQSEVKQLEEHIQ